ncbi:glycosyltransferase [Spirulina major CS-329]|nr:MULTISPECIES: glycosyltransferase family 2 protein [Spirulina]MDB9505080.1 glycosyltransferase [Spirulina major CS-329]
MMSRIGVVTIGRNEGDRLIRCLQSLRDRLPDDVPIVYVDSGSTDDSMARAAALGVRTIALDLSIPFTAARSRNTGFDRLLETDPNLDYVQFLDGDCELMAGWIEAAIAHLDANPDCAIVCGRRRERFPDASPYNRLADMEWNTPVGPAPACGGDSLARVKALQGVNGFNPRLICGEEPEMCIRLRQQDWTIFRLDADMTLHDAAMTQFKQFWKRSVRGGWAVAEGYVMYGQPPEQYMQRQYKSGWLWGIVVPLLGLLLAWPTRGLSLLLWLGYPYLIWRVYRYRRQSFRDRPTHARLYAFYTVLSKLPQAIGQLQYWLTQWRGKQATLIEYKG